MSFAAPFALFLLIPLLVVAAVSWWRPRGSALQFSYLGEVDTGRSVRLRALVLPTLRWIVLLALVVAMLRPQTQAPQSKRLSDGLDIVLAIDTSGSMRALDFTVAGERSDRLTAVRTVIEKFIDERTSDRIGFVVFGSEAFTQAPLTIDHGILRQFLSEIKIGMAGDATAIGDAIAVAATRLEKIPSPSRLVILLTDGRNTAGAIEPTVAAKAAAALGVRIYTIGVGAEGDVPFPVETPFGTQIRYQPSDLDEAGLRAVASVGQGQYFRAYDTDSLKKVYDTIDKLEKTKLNRTQPGSKTEWFALVLAVALGALLLEMLLSLSRLRRAVA